MSGVRVLATSLDEARVSRLGVEFSLPAVQIPFTSSRERESLKTRCLVVIVKGPAGNRESLTGRHTL